MAIAAPQPRVIADVFGHSAVRNAVLVAGGAAFVGLSAQIAFYLPWNPAVPVTLQTFAVVLAAVYVSLFTAVLVGVAGVVGLAFWCVTRMPEQPPRSVEAQVALLEQAWDQEVPASQQAMVAAYLADPEAAVAALVGSRTSVSPEAARRFLAARVTG